MRIKFNLYIFLLFFIIFFSLDGFYLLNPEFIPTKDLAFILEVVFIGLSMKPILNTRKYFFSRYIVFVIFISIYSSFVATYTYNQPFLLGFRPQRHWIGAMLMYFPITALLRKSIIKENELLKMVDFVTIVYSTLLILQYLVSSKNLFLYIDVNVRYGSIRLYANVSFLLISLFYHFDLLLKTNKKIIKNALLMGVPAFVIIFILKSRMMIVALISVIAFAILCQKFSLKKMVFISFGLFALLFVYNSEMGKDIINMILNNGNSTQDTSSIRNAGREYFLNKCFSSPMTTIFGYGYPNITWEEAYISSGYSKYYFMSDNGLFGLFFYYGLIFIVWYLALNIKTIKLSIKTKMYYGMRFFLAGLLGSYTLIPDCYSTNIASSIIISLICLKKSNYYEGNECQSQLQRIPYII